MKNVAVIIRGHLRTWNYIKPVVFDFFDSIADNVDYYFATWDIYDPVVIHYIRQDFNSRNLIKLLTVPVTDMDYNGWISSGFFNYLLIPYKKQRERQLQIKYDAVFDTRPDIMPRRRPGGVIPPEPMTLYTTYFNNQRGMLYDPDSEYMIGLGDHFFMMADEVHDIISQRYILPCEFGPHVEFQHMCQAEGINACKISWADGGIIRPNSIDDCPDPFKYYGSMIGDWIAMPSDQKKECLTRHSIKFEDYITHSATCSI